MQIAERDAESGNQYKSKKGIVALVIASFNMTEFLEVIEKAFYCISMFVDFLIKRPRAFDVLFLRPLCTCRGDKRIYQFPFIIC